MKVIKISVNFDFFLIEKINKRITEIDVNSNKQVNDSFYFTEKYIKWNKDTISDLLNSMNFSSAFYKDYDSFLIMSSILNVSEVSFDIKKSVPNKVIDILLKNKNVRKINCYFMPSEYINLLSLSGVCVNFNNDMLFTLDFVKNNDFKLLKNIYYRKVIRFDNECEVYDNLESFLKVNQNLKLIHLYFYSNEVISYIVDKLNEFKVVDVDIFIHQNEENISLISNGSDYLKKINKKYSNKNREIKIIYSEQFFRDNIFKELTLNGMKLCMIVILYIGVVFMISDKYHEYVTFLNLRLLEESLGNTNNDELVNIDEMDDNEVNPPEDVVVEEPVVEEPAPPKVYVNHYANIPTTFDKLLSINSEVVGWINVNNTKINYPVTQHSDNSYYLSYDIYNKKVITGWIFMDYRNDPVDLDKNTIIYGHNTTSGYMFGDLKGTSNKSWYTNKNNQVITYKSLDKEMNWLIFSIYRTDYTTDYLKTGFYNDAQFMEFVDMIKGRSVYNFNVNVDASDKILTLSSCTGSNNRRIVVHAVLMD